MGQISTQLWQLFVQSIPTIVLVIILLAFLNRLFFKPLSQTLDARVKATSGALVDARQQAERAEEKMREYDRAIQATRLEIYQHREDVRRKSLDERDSKVHKARSRAEETVKDAQAGLDKETAVAKSELRMAIDTLATEVTVSLFAPHVSMDGQGDVQA